MTAEYKLTLFIGAFVLVLGYVTSFSSLPPGLELLDNVQLFFGLWYAVVRCVGVIRSRKAQRWYFELRYQEICPPEQVEAVILQDPRKTILLQGWNG